MSQITIVNNTDDNEVVRIAIYKRPAKRPTLETIAWRVIAPPPSGGQTIVTIPQQYSVYANYSFDPDERKDPDAGSRTRVIQFAETTARFCVQSRDSQDGRASAASLTQSFNELVLNEVRIENHFSTGVWGHITLDGEDVYAPQVIWPGGVRMEDLRSTFYLAVVAEFVNQGDRLVDEEVSITQTPILSGGTAVVTGSMWTGYSIDLG